MSNTNFMLAQSKLLDHLFCYFFWKRFSAKITGWRKIKKIRTFFFEATFGDIFGKTRFQLWICRRAWNSDHYTALIFEFFYKYSASNWTSYFSINWCTLISFQFLPNPTSFSQLDPTTYTFIMFTSFVQNNH